MMTFLSNIKSRIWQLISIVIGAFAIFQLVSSKKTEKKLNDENKKLTKESADLKTKIEKDRADRATETIKKTEQNKRVGRNVQKKIDEVVTDKPSVSTEETSSTNKPERGKEFLLSILLLIFVSLATTACGGKEVVIQTEYIFVQPEYVKLHPIYPKEFPKVRFTPIDNNSYSITYDDLNILTDKQNDFKSVIDKLNKQILIYNEMVDNLTSGE